ncbi:small ribosomal subunit protein uS15m isoform X1 [Procambarus clarkii]|uniref:small ribosomal subunit protein uS15m isoform X1 n=1 Tax=Procambarus clarkii TaxID=6728 RepID=UPI003742A750
MALRVLRCVCGGRGVGAMVTGLSPSTRPTLTPAIIGYEQKRYAMRLELTEHGIKWRRPEYIPSWRPEKSGDLELHKDPDEMQPRIEVLPAKDMLDQVDEDTRKLLSLKFATHGESMKIKHYEMLRRVQRHQLDTSSMEVKIAALTVKIQNLQRVTFKCKKNIIERVRLQEMIDRRKKLLKNLRKADYKRFEWLLEELNLLYRPFPREYKWITRKDSLQKLVQMHGEELKEKRLAEYQAALELQKEPFLKEKVETLRWIAETETSLGVPVSVVVPEDPTVTHGSNSDIKE